MLQAMIIAVFVLGTRGHRRADGALVGGPRTRSGPPDGRMQEVRAAVPLARRERRGHHLHRGPGRDHPLDQRLRRQDHPQAGGGDRGRNLSDIFACPTAEEPLLAIDEVFESKKGRQLTHLVKIDERELWLNTSFRRLLDEEGRSTPCSASPATSPTSGRSRSRTTTPRSWPRSGRSPPAWPTRSTTRSPSSSGSPTCSSRRPRRAPRPRRCCARSRATATRPRRSSRTC